jgi:hypothetical protein
MADVLYLFDEETLFGIKKDATGYIIPRKETQKQQKKPKKDQKSREVDPDFFPCAHCSIKGLPVLSKTCSAKNPVMLIGAYPGYHEAKA